MGRVKLCSNTSEFEKVDIHGGGGGGGAFSFIDKSPESSHPVTRSVLLSCQ